MPPRAWPAPDATRRFVKYMPYRTGSRNGRSVSRIARGRSLGRVSGHGGGPGRNYAMSLRWHAAIRPGANSFNSGTSEPQIGIA